MVSLIALDNELLEEQSPLPKKEKQKSPYPEFKRWLFDRRTDSILDQDIINKLSMKFVLMSFSNLNEITIFLNKYFNKIELLSYKNKEEEFYKFLKYEIVQPKNIQYNDLCFMKDVNPTTKNNKIKKANPQYKYLRDYELRILKLI